MRFAPAARRLTMWAALLAVLLAALAPTLSRAMAAADGPGALEVCSVAGRAPDDGTPADGVAHPFEHCPWCSGHLPTPALPPAPPATVPAAEVVREWPAAFLAAPATPHAWSSARARAPPSLA